MAIERFWDAVPPQLFTANGGQYGQVSIASTRGFKVKQRAVIKATGQPDLVVEIKRVPAVNALIVGRLGTSLTDRTLDLSAYTTALGAFIYADEQAKTQLTKEDRLHATYDQEPTVAWRNVLVDQLGRYYEENNPLPVQLSGGSVFIETVSNNISVFMTHRDNYPNPDDEHDSIRIGDGNTEVQNNYGPSANAFRTAAQVGNANGAADFNAGATTGQTQRVSANITRNGTELAYDSGASNANTLRASANLKREGNDLDYGYGTVGINTLRVGSQIGNATGSADFGAGVTGAQTLRASVNITRNGTELSYNIGTPDANTLRIAAILANSAGQVDYNHGAVGAQTQRVAAVLSNESAKADFNAGATGTATLRASANITRNGNELSYAYGAVDANTLRIASQIGNATGAADFGAGTTTAQTLRTVVNLHDSAANGITSTLVDTKRSLDVRESTRGRSTMAASIPVVLPNDQIGADAIQIQGNAANGAAAVGNPLQVAGTDDSGNIRTISTNTDGDLRTVPRGQEIGGLSTSTPLVGGGIWTGAWTKVTDYAVISFTVFSDVASAANGLSIQWSSDGVNIDRTENSNVSAGVGRAFSLGVRARYFRIIYTNGAIPQGSFRLATDAHPHGTGIVTRPLSQSITDDNFAQLVTSVTTGKNTTGQYVPHRSNSISSVNSTSTPIGSSGTYVGTWEEILGFTNISILLFTDQPSATDGLILEYSSDGINVDDNDFYSIIANNGQTFTVGVHSRYFRVRYINGSIAQTQFRLQTVYHITAPKPSSHRVQDNISGQNDAELVKAVITGAKPDGSYENQAIQGNDPNNSTTTPLGANDVYRGNWFPWSLQYSGLITLLKANTAGTLFIDFSNSINPINGVEDSVDATLASAHDPDISDTGRRSTPLQSKWVRHRYVNGPVAQTIFTLDAIFTVADPRAATQAYRDLPSLSSQASLVRSVPAIPNPTGTAYVEVPVAPSGNPKTHVAHIEDDVLIEPLDSAQALQTTVGTTPVRLDPSPLADRRVINIDNEGPVRIAIGHSSGITFNSGSIRIPVGGSRTLGISPTVPVWAVAENLGGIQTTLQRSPASATGTATNPSNVLISDNVYANISANGQTINTTGFTAGTTNTLVSVKLGIEGNKASAAPKVVAFQEHRTGSSDNSSSVTTTASVTATTGHFYVAAISRRNTSATVTGVSGLGLTWSLLTSVINLNTTGIIDVWVGNGTPTLTSTVTASFSAVSIHNHIAVTRYSNVDLTAPVQSLQTGTGNNATPTITSPLTGTANGYAYAAVFGANRTMTAGSGYTLRSSELTNDGGNSDSLSVEDKALTVSGSETPTGTLSGNANWVMIALALTPAPADNPVVRLSYTLSGVPGATAQNLTFSGASDGTQYVDITADRAWVVADVPNIVAIATGQTIGTAAANIDYMFLELTDTTGNTARVSVWQGGRAVT